MDVSVDADVEDNYARVDVEATIVSNGTRVEVPFRVPVPDDAFISGLSIERDGTTYEAHVEPAPEAREVYRTAKATGQTAGLVERSRDASVYTYDVNVGPGQTVNATLTYETYLTADRGEYTLDLPAPRFPGDRLESLTYRALIDHRGGLEDAWSSPNATQTTTSDGLLIERTDPIRPAPNASNRSRAGDEPRSFTVGYTLEETPRWGELVATVENGTGYFAHRFRAAGTGAQLPLDLALVLDTSGSMDGLKIDQLRQAATRVVDLLDEEDRLHLAPFDEHVEPAWPGLQAADETTRADAKEAISTLEADGSTHIEAALTSGLTAMANTSSTDEERMPVLVFLTDGRATTGLEDPDGLRRVAREANTVGASVFSLAFGDDADIELVQGLADDANGTAVHVEEGPGAEEDIERFLAALTTPVLRDVEIAYAGNVTAVDRTASTLFAGSEMLVVGTFDPNLTQLDATVSARTATGPASWELTEPTDDEGASYLPRLVAYHRLMELQAHQRAYGADETTDAQIQQLALEHGFVTDQTSLVLQVPPPERLDPATNATTNRSTGNTTNATASNATLPNATSPRNVTLHLDADGDGLADVVDAAPSMTRDTARDAQGHAGGGGAGGGAADRGARDTVQDTTSAPKNADGWDASTGDGDPSSQGTEAQETPATSVVLLVGLLATLAVLRRHPER